MNASALPAGMGGRPVEPDADWSSTRARLFPRCGRLYRRHSRRVHAELPVGASQAMVRLEAGLGRTVVDERAMVENADPPAQQLDGGGVVGHKQNGLALFRKPLHRREATLLEVFVPDRED